MFWALVLFVLLVWFSYVYLRGENLSYLDRPRQTAPAPAPSAQHYDVVKKIQGLMVETGGFPGREQVQVVRELMDRLGTERAIASTVTSVDRAGIKGEWVQADGVDTLRRVLYLHGGAWFSGSPRSHRPITDRLSRELNAAVFCLDYRLLPEHRRIDGIVDCREGLRWILHNGPETVEPPDFLVVAGDSAGGSLTLEVIAWARDCGLRLPHAAIAFSPSTDATMTSPSLRENVATDPMIGPAFGKLLRFPTPLLWWFYWISWRIAPKDPRVSPLRGNLAGLPPVLIQASDAEMLLDDARRYASKAQAAGAPVTLQTWPHMVHVWQMFNPELPEAEDAFAKVRAFIAAIEIKEDARRIA